MKPGESGYIAERRSKGITKRRREVLYHVAFGGMHGSRWRRRQILTPIRRDPVVVYTLNGTDVSGILNWLKRQRLIRTGYVPKEGPATGFYVITGPFITAKGIEELLCPTM